MRTKSMIVSIILLAAVALSAYAPSGIAANPAAPQRTLNVNGAGQVSLTPDIAYIYVGVHTENASASDAMTENNSRTQVMIDASRRLVLTRRTSAPPTSASGDRISTTP